MIIEPVGCVAKTAGNMHFRFKSCRFVGYHGTIIDAAGLHPDPSASTKVIMSSDLLNGIHGHIQHVEEVGVCSVSLL